MSGSGSAVARLMHGPRPSAARPPRPAVHGALAGALHDRPPRGLGDRARADGVGRDRPARRDPAALRPAQHHRPGRLAAAAPLAGGVVGRHRGHARAGRRLGRLAQPLLPAVARRARAARPRTCRCATRRGWRSARRWRSCSWRSGAGPRPGHLQVTSTETLAIHLSLPTLLVGGLAYVCDTLRRLSEERSQRERLAIEAERRRIAWELHDSAKQRLHAAHLLVSSLSGPRG